MDVTNESEKPPLCAAAESGDEETVVALLACGVPVDSPSGGGFSSFYNSRTFPTFGWSALMFACWEGHENIARLLLDAGASPNRLARRVTPLVLAAGHGHANLVRLLLARGARPRVQHPEGGSFSALVTAAKGRKVECVRILLDAGESPDAADIHAGKEKGLTALLAAVRSGNGNIVHLLLSHGADPTAQGANGNDALSSAIDYVNRTADKPALQKTRKKILHLMLTANPLPLTLHQAAALGDVARVRELLDAGVDPNIDNYLQQTPLWVAISHDRIVVAALLIKHGGRLHLSDWTMLCLAASRGHARMVFYLLDRKLSNLDMDGPSALIIAARCSHATAVVRLLLERGVDSNSGNGQPLRSAAAGCFFDMTNLLLLHGALPNLANEHGETALMCALQSYDADRNIVTAIEILLDHGADPTLRDNKGRNALDIAEENENELAIDILQKVIARASQPANCPI